MTVVLAATLLSRLAFAFIIWRISGPLGFYDADSLDYVTKAQSLLHGTFSDNGIPHIVRTPGYPLLLVPAVGSGHLVLFALFENLLLAVGSAWLVWQIAVSIFPGSEAWAVLLYCFEPVGLLYSEKIMSETLFTAQLLLFIWLTIRFLREPSYATLLLAALALGCATYTRPVTLYLGVWLMPLFLLFPRRLPLSQRGTRAVLFLVVFALSLAPWTFRNAKVAGYLGFSSISDLSLYFYSAAAIKAKLEHKTFAQEQEEMGFLDDQRYFQAHPEQTTWSRGKISHFMGTEAKRIISQNLSSYLPIHARGFIIVLFDTVATVILQTLHLYPERGGLLVRTVDQGFYRGAMWLIRQHPIAAMVFFLLGIQLLLYYVLALLAVRYLPFAIVGFVGWFSMYFILVSGGPVASGRYRSPVIPLIAVFAGVTIATWRAARHSRKIPKPEGESI